MVEERRTKRFGEQEPKYTCGINPFVDARFSKCPEVFRPHSNAKICSRHPRRFGRNLPDTDVLQMVSLVRYHRGSQE